jgi:DNA-binding response OmpR family regulator
MALRGPAVKTVLLVDYDPRSIDTMRRCVMAFGARMLLATDAETGRREFFRAMPDLVIIEDLIPKTRGYQLCRDLKSSMYGAYRPVLLVGGRNGGKHRVITSRCDGYIERPFDDATLLAHIAKLLPGISTYISRPA